MNMTSPTSMMYPQQEQTNRPTPKKLQFALPANQHAPLGERDQNRFPSSKRGTPHPKAKSEAGGTTLDTSASHQLKGWLNEYGTAGNKPVPTKRLDVGKGPSMTPVRFKTRLFEDVQATDDGYASVKKLASWLADDPTKKKDLVGHVRKGINVISKSRKFEKELADVILDDDEDVVTKMQSVKDEPHVCVADKKKWLQGAFPKKVDNCDDFDDTVTEVSVTDKKKWLENAFSNKGPPRASSVANSCPPVMMSIKASAKDKWRQKRQSLNAEQQQAKNGITKKSTPEMAVMIADAPPKVLVEPATKLARVDALTNAIGGDPEKPAVAPSTAHTQLQSKPMDTSRVDWRRSLGSKHVKKQTIPVREATIITGRPIVTVPAFRPLPNVAVEPAIADEEVVDFKAARQLLVERGVKNGNPVMLSKVQIRKTQFEKWEQNIKKATAPKGLLKPAWEQATPSKGPSHHYIKSYVSDIAPKRSFDELP